MHPNAYEKREYLEKNADVVITMRRLIFQKRRQDLALEELGDVVYFVRRGDFIKIGHSRRLKQRLSALDCKLTDLLHVMPGGSTVEHEMHMRFRHLAVGGEHFMRGRELIDFINDQRELMGVDIHPLVH